MAQEKTMVFHIFNDTLEAGIIQDKLKANGIDSFLKEENPIGLNPMGGTELKIFAKDRERAEKIIAK